MHLSAQAAMTPSGLPPIPIMISTGAPALATSMAPDTSPSEINRILQTMLQPIDDDDDGLSLTVHRFHGID